MVYIYYGLAAAALTVSFFKSKEKTKAALKKAWKSFENIMPQFLGIILLIGIMLSILSPEQISGFLGGETGFLGVLLASVVGAITLMPGFVAFPLAAALLKNGAGVMQIAAFVSSLMMVGVITLPLEIQVFGKKATFLRNGAAYLFSLAVALIMGAVLL